MIRRFDIEEIGKFLKTHALKGELNARLDIDASFIGDETPLIVDIDGIYVPFYPESVRSKGHFSSLIKLQGIDSEEAARQFVNKTIYARKEDVSAFVGEEEDGVEGAYADDLIGWQLRLTDGKIIGEITDVDDSTQNLLFIVETPDGNRVYVPAAEQLIAAIDPDSHVIEMSLPEGLLDINS